MDPYDYPPIDKLVVRQIFDYVVHGVPPGSFVRAVLENNLVGAIFSADEDNLSNIAHIAHFVYWAIPAASWGGRASVNEWIADPIGTRARLSETAREEFLREIKKYGVEDGWDEPETMIPSVVS